MPKPKEIVLNDSMEKLNIVGGFQLPKEYRSCLGYGVRISRLMPPKHRRALKFILEKKPSLTGILGGRGCIKSSFCSFLSIFRSAHGDGDTVVLSKSRYTYENFKWAIGYAKSTNWSIRHTPVKTFTYDAEELSFSKRNGTTTKRITSHVYFLPADREQVLWGFCLGKNIRHLWIEDGDQLDDTTVHDFINSIPHLEDIIVTFSAGDTKFFDSNLYHYYTSGKLFRFSYEDVPTRYLGRHFFNDVNILRNYNHDLYIREYLGLPVIKDRLYERMHRKELEILTNAAKF